MENVGSATGYQQMRLIDCFFSFVVLHGLSLFVFRRSTVISKMLSNRYFDDFFWLGASLSTFLAARNVKSVKHITVRRFSHCLFYEQHLIDIFSLLVEDPCCFL